MNDQLLIEYCIKLAKCEAELAAAREAIGYAVDAYHDATKETAMFHELLECGHQARFCLDDETGECAMCAVVELAAARQSAAAWKLCAKNLRRDFIAQGKALIETKNKLTNAQVNRNTFVGIVWPQKAVLETSCYHHWIDGVCEYCGNVSKMP